MRSKVSVRLDTEQLARVSKLGRELGLNESEAIRAAIMRGLEHDQLEQRLARLEALLEDAASALGVLIEKLDKCGLIKT